MEGGQMSGKTLTLLLIMAFVALTLGSFVWFILSWDKATTQSVTPEPKLIEERIA
jgi:hypothetical protein